jgi:acyl-CoA thioesterase
MHVFDRDLALTQLEPMAYQAEVTGNWSVNGIPNGGYLLALLAAAMLQRSVKQTPLVVTANYLQRCRIGDARIDIENIATSKRFDRWQARLVQEGVDRVRALGTFLDGAHPEAYKRYEKDPPEVVDPDACVAVPMLDNLTIMRQLEIRLDPASAGWLTGALAGKSEQKGWVRFREERPFDLVSLLLAADCFPPAVFVSHGMSAWVPTIELTVNLRNLPATPWLKCVFRTSFVNGDILEEDGEVWDAAGELVALSRQIAQVRRSG